MKLNGVVSDFLWALFRTGLMDKNLKRAVDKIADFYEEINGELSENLDSLLTSFWSQGTESALFNLAKNCAEEFSFNLNRHTRLVAYLYAKGFLDLDRALALLDFRGQSIDELPEGVVDVAKAVWLSEQDGHRYVGDDIEDDLLSEKLLTLAREGLVQ